jgi:hypothetical protein
MIPVIAGLSWLAKSFIPSTLFGVGYTGGAYLGYGTFNTVDPLKIHKGKKPYTANNQLSFMPYGSYGRRRYSRYSRYTRYRRRRPYYSRRSYY